MKRRPGLYPLCCTLLITALLAPAYGQLAKRSRGPVAAGSGSSAELISAGDNPVVRFAVGHQHAASGCGGYLYFSRDTIRYEVVGPESDKGHSFEYSRADLTVAGQWRFMGTVMPEAEFKFRRGGTYHFFHLRKDRLNDPATAAKIKWDDVLPFQELVDAATNFDHVVDTLKVRDARLHPAPPPPPPTISMLEPAALVSGNTLDTTLAQLHLRGIASHASGISAVSVNGQNAFLRTLAPQTVEFDIQNVPLNSGSSAVVVLATATDKTQSQAIFTVNRAEVRVLEPAPKFETAAASVTIRGVAVGFQNVDKVEVAGVSGTLHRRDDGQVEFEIPVVPLVIGGNTLQGSLTAPGGVRQSFVVEGKRLPPAGPPPLTLAEVEKALHDGVTPARVGALVSKFGVDFALDDAAEKTLRAAGADSELLLVIARSKK